MPKKVGEIFVEANVTGDGDKRMKAFGLTLSDAKAGLDIFVGVVKAAASAVKDLTIELANQGDEIAKSAKNIGISAEAMQEFDFAAKLAGQDAKAVQTAIQRMAKGMNDARVRGTGPFADGLKQMGLRLRDFDALAPDQAFEKLADSIANIRDPIEKAALAQDFFGRGGKTLLPLLNEGAAGIREMRKEFRELGGGFTNDGAAGAEEFVDAMLRAETVVDSFKIAAFEEFSPLLTEMIDGIREWGQENRAAISEELKKFIRDMIALFKASKPTIEALLPLLRDFALFIAEVFAETGQLIKQIKDLDRELGISEKLWADITEPIREFSKFIDIVAEKIDNLLGRIEDLGGGVGEFAAGVRGALFIDDPEDVQRTNVRGAPPVQGGPIRRSSSVSLDRASSSLLQKVISNKSNPESLRNQARTLLPAAKQREKALIDASLGAVRETKRIQRENKRIEKEQRNAARRRRTRARNAVRGGKKKGISNDELLKLISKAGSQGISLDQLTQGRKIEGGTPPVISVTVTNNNIEMPVKIDSVVNGVPGTTAEDVAAQVESGVSRALQRQLKNAADKLNPLVSR